MCNLISCHNRFPLPHRKCTRQINGFQLAVLLSQRHMPSSLCSADLDPASDPGRVSYYASALTHDRGLQGTRNQKKVSRSRFSRAGQLDLQLSVKKGATMTPFPAAREQGVDFFFFVPFFPWSNGVTYGPWSYRAGGQKAICHARTRLRFGKKWLASRCLPAPTRGRFIFLEAC